MSELQGQMDLNKYLPDEGTENREQGTGMAAAAHETKASSLFGGGAIVSFSDIFSQCSLLPNGNGGLQPKTIETSSSRAACASAKFPGFCARPPKIRVLQFPNEATTPGFS